MSDFSRQQFIKESQTLEQIFNEDNEWVYQWCEFIQRGEKQKAKFVETQIRPQIKKKMDFQMKRTLDAMEKLCQTNQNE